MTRFASRSAKERTWRFAFLAALMAVAFLLAAGCGDDDPVKPKDDPDPDPIIDEDAVIKDNVVVIEDEPMDLTTINGDTYVYSFSGPAPDVQVGDIIVSDGSNAKSGFITADDTYLRKVVSRTIDGQTMQLVTTEASLVDAVQECDINTSVPLTLGPVGNLGYLFPGLEVTDNTLRLSDVTLIDESFYLPPPININVLLYAAIDDAFIKFHEPKLDLGFTIVDSEVTKFHTILDTRIELGCDLTAEISADWNYDIPSIELYRKTDTYTTWVLFVPVVHRVTTTVTFETEIELAGGARAEWDDLRVDIDSSVGARFQQNAWEYVDDTTLNTEIPDPELSAYASARVKPYIRVKVEDKLYGVGGPNVRAEPYIEAIASTDFQEWCLDVEIGCDVGCGASLDLGILDPGLDLAWDSPGLNLFSWDAYHDCWPLMSAVESRALPIERPRVVLLR